MTAKRAEDRGIGFVHTIRSLRGNQRACVYTEPLWGIPFNLYAPMAAVYMVALGLSPIQIGLVETIYFLSQTVSAALAGPLTDKLGRRLCTAIFDTFAWIIPLLLWSLAQDFTWFAVAAALNGLWRIPENSWGLLYVEDAPPDRMIQLYAIISMAGLVAALVSPATILLRQHFSLVSLVRVLYFFTFAMMVLKVILLYLMSHETEVGVRRRIAVKDVSILKQVWDSRLVVGRMVKNRRIVLVLLLLTCFAVIRSINDKFWPLLLTEQLGIQDTMLPLFNTIRSVVMLVLYLLVVPRLDLRSFMKPMVTAMLCLGIVSLALLFLPAGQGAFAVVTVGVMLEGVAMAVLTTILPALKMQVLDREERAGMLGLLTMLSLLMASLVAPFAGILSQARRSLPMLLQCCMAVAGVVVTLRLDMLGLTDDDSGHHLPKGA